jgi:ABC-type Mn2+/Zn2+ transport system ATPase subunit
MKPLVHINQLTFGYSHEPVLEDVDLKIFDNDFIGVIGPNGGGKTTLLKAILGLIRPQKGKIYFREDLPRHKRPIGYLPQVKHLDRQFPITVIDVVRSGSLMRSIPVYQFCRREEYSTCIAGGDGGIGVTEESHRGVIGRTNATRIFMPGTDQRSKSADSR